MDSMATNPKSLRAAIVWLTSVLAKWYYAVPIYLTVLIIVFIVCLCDTQPPLEADSSPHADIEPGNLAPATPVVDVAAVVVRPRPILLFKDMGKVGDLCCSICLDEFQGDDRVDAPFKCKHVFHLICIDLWLRRSFFCPICRSIILPQYLVK